MAEVNFAWVDKAEGAIYGEGAGAVCRAVAKAAAGKKRAKEQAAAVHEALRELAAEWGYKPDIEVFMREPGPDELCREGYRVSWESGPFEWAIPASDALAQVDVFAEPYYSFDLCFYPSEDR